MFVGASKNIFIQFLDNFQLCLLHQNIKKIFQNLIGLHKYLLKTLLIGVFYLREKSINVTIEKENKEKF